MYLINRARDKAVRPSSSDTQNGRLQGKSMTATGFLIGFFIFVGSVALGALGYERWLSHVVATRKKVARNHTLRSKPLASRDELQVWRWLEEVFPGHRILPKIPFTGFIEPNQRGGDAHWQALLGTVSFSCALADHKGTVLGCIDVLGRGEVTERQHRIPLYIVTAVFQESGDLGDDRLFAEFPERLGRAGPNPEIAVFQEFGDLGGD